MDLQCSDGLYKYVDITRAQAQADRSITFNLFFWAGTQ